MESLPADTVSVTREFLLPFRCPVCDELFTPPVYICMNGHSLCSVCMAKVRNCPLCRGPIQQNSRNIILEEILRKVSITCKFEGCNQPVTLASRQEHEQECSFNTLLQCVDCGRQVADLAHHLVNSHCYAERTAESAASLTFARPLDSWKAEGDWPKELWKLKNQLLLVCPKIKGGVFHLALFRITKEPVNVKVAIESAEFSLIFKGTVPNISEFDRQSEPHFHCNVDLLVHNCLVPHEEDSRLLKLCVQVYKQRNF